MSNPEEWNIHNIDAEALQKITQIAHEQGVTAREFIESLMHKNVPHSKETLLEINQRLQEAIPPKPQTARVQKTQKNTVDTTPKTQNKTRTRTRTRTAATQNNTNTRRSAPKVSTPRTKTHNLHKIESKNNMFKTLTKKIGITNSVIEQISDTNITDTIIRERQLRDFMRVQMTEMRNIMGTMFEKKIDDKLQELTALLDATQQEQAQFDSSDFQNGLNDVLKAEDFNFKVALLEDNTHTKILNSITQKLSVTVKELCDNHHQQSEYIIKKIETIIHDILTHQPLSPITAAHNDSASVTMLPDSTVALLPRIENIEHLCSELNTKLSQINPHEGNHHQNIPVSHFDNAQVDTLKSDLKDIVKSIKDDISEKIDANNNHAEEHYTHIFNILENVSDRLSHLEQSIQDTKTHRKIVDPITDFNNNDSNSDFLTMNKPLYDEPEQSAASNILENDWDEEDTPSPPPMPAQNDKKPDMIRNLDRKAILKSSELKKAENEQPEPTKQSIITKLFKKLT